MRVANESSIVQAKARLGRVLRGKWRLDALLGVGGMAAVYAATHRNGTRAAVKVLRPDVGRVPHLRRCFLREGYLANKVGHPGAVSILDDDRDTDGTAYLVMELLTGETLEQRWARRGNMPWQDALVIAHRALDVLAAAHARGIVHRDVKPANLFLDVERGVKVLDFGIAQLEERPCGVYDSGQGRTLGTPAFMPPEQACGLTELVDSRSDVFGVGATLFAVISGRHVHEAPTAAEELVLAMSKPAAPIAAYANGLPQAVGAVVDRALAFERDDRFPDAQSMRGAIARAHERELGYPIAEAPRMSVRVRPMDAAHFDAPTLADGRRASG